MLWYVKQIDAMFLWECKTVASQREWSQLPPCTTTTTDPGAPDCRRGIMAPPEEAGSLSTATLINGCRLTWESRPEWRESLPRVGMTPTSGWNPTLCPTVTTVWGSFLLNTEGRSRYKTFKIWSGLREMLFFFLEVILGVVVPLLSLLMYMIPSSNGQL